MDKELILKKVILDVQEECKKASFAQRQNEYKNGEKISRAETQREHLENWYGPNGFTITTKKFDLRVGGKWIFIFHGPDGTNYYNRIFFEKFEKNKKIEYRCDEKDNDPNEFRSVITFGEKNKDTTLVTLRTILKSKEARDFVVNNFNAIEGGKQTLERLKKLVEKL